MQFLQLLGASIWVISLAAALPRSLVNITAVNDPAPSKTLPASVVNDPTTNTTFANQTLPNSDCASRGDCGIIGPAPIISSPADPYAGNCDGSALCTTAGCPGAGNAISGIIEVLSYMKPTAKYVKHEQMACWWCKSIDEGDAVCAWVDGPDGSEMTIDDAWGLLKALPKECTQCKSMRNQNAQERQNG
ncbi:hypothetical protein SLS60_007088 [Paraconiothyrium brasiliense]|uniref:Killer toxin Kp4 domain-containing protein n=1 Tax=Paraconiothyrium brasiliense TaxID=300254 RepID=A0ABR3R8C9_9PLEO